MEDIRELKTRRVTPSIHHINVRDSFDEELEKQGDDSLWFYGLLMLLNIPGFCNMIFYTVFLKQNSNTRCAIPELEDKWSFEEIQEIAQPTKLVKNCSFYAYDYKDLANQSFIEAVEYLQNKSKPDILQCHNTKTIPDHFTFYREFNLYCRGEYTEYIILISPLIGMFVAGIFLTFLGDLFGRKRMLQWGVNMYIFIAILLPISTCLEAIVMYRILGGVAYQLIETAIQAIIFEVSNPENWGYRFMLMYCGSSIGYLISHALTKVTVNWRYLQWAISTPFLLLPIVAWYIPESAVWLIEHGERDKAFALLRTIKDPVRHSNLLLLFRNDVVSYYSNFRDLIYYFSEYAKIHLWFFVLIMAPLSCINFKSWSILMDLQTKWKLGNMFYGIGSAIGDVPAVMISESMLYVLNRKKSLLFTYLVCGSVFILASFFSQNTWQLLVILLIADIETGVLNLIGTLYGAENTPITQRCAAIGWTMSFGKSLPKLIMVSINLIYTPTQMMITAACISFVGAAFLILAYLFVEDFRVDFFQRPHFQ